VSTVPGDCPPAYGGVSSAAASSRRAEASSAGATSTRTPCSCSCGSCPPASSADTAALKLETTATDTVAPSTISTPLLLLLPVGRYWHHGRTSGGRRTRGKLWPGPVGGSGRPTDAANSRREARARCVPDRRSIYGDLRSLMDTRQTEPQISDSAGSRSTAAETSQADSASSILVTRSR
jgi:hypothetical protein